MVRETDHRNAVANAKERLRTSPDRESVLARSRWLITQTFHKEDLLGDSIADDIGRPIALVDFHFDNTGIDPADTYRVSDGQQEILMLCIRHLPELLRASVCLMERCNYEGLDSATAGEYEDMRSLLDKLNIDGFGMTEEHGFDHD